MATHHCPTPECAARGHQALALPSGELLTWQGEVLVGDLDELRGTCGLKGGGFILGTEPAPVPEGVATVSVTDWIQRARRTGLR